MLWFRVLSATNYYSNLYRDDGIVFDDDWVNKYNIENFQQDENDDSDIGNPQLESATVTD